MRSGLAKRLSRAGIGFRRLGPASWIALCIVVVIILAAVFASVLAPHSPYVQEAKGGGPSASHWMGLDSANRDVFTRLLYGARWSLIIGLG
ncbi:MAG: transporter, partial [Actinoallomurus sp.]|nr:transporter [Actinoallomurus sp.]